MYTGLSGDLVCYMYGCWWMCTCTGVVGCVHVYMGGYVRTCVHVCLHASMFVCVRMWCMVCFTMCVTALVQGVIDELANTAKLILLSMSLCAL